ncbi:MAG: stage V sporulation protein AC [Clostridia bacterium]|nr:stage V sporulation protein AC [Clostridia bacterium]
MNKKEYTEYVESKADKSSILKNCIIAFIIGGLICIVGQIITDIALNYGLDKKTAGTISSISLIFIGALLTALKLYQPLGKFAGAGSIVPITGFSNSIVSPAIEYKSEGLILGIGANMFKVAGPVLVYGIGSSVILGLIYYIFNIFM